MKKTLKTLLFLIITSSLMVYCKSKENTAPNQAPNELVGTWHLTTKGQNIFDKGVIIYSTDGQMSVILSKKDSVVTGYSGKYEVNANEKYVTHYRDYYPLLPYVNDSTPPVWIRDYTLSEDKNTLKLSPREDKSFSLIWERIKK
jgi:hypothetical protein